MFCYLTWDVVALPPPLLQVLPGLQSLPLLRLPIMLSPDHVRHWSFDGALVDFRLARFPGAPGDIEQAQHGVAGEGCCSVVAPGYSGMND